MVPSLRADFSARRTWPHDLALAGDDGFESGCHGEEVLRDPTAGVHRIGALELGGADTGRRLDGFEHGFDADRAAWP